MNGAVLAALAGHWRRNPLHLVTLVAGLALATALWSGVQAINAEARASYDTAAATLGEGRLDQIVMRAGGPMPQARFVALRRAGWLVSPVVEGRWQGHRLIGLEPLTVPRGIAAGAVAARIDLAALVRDGVLVAAPATARGLSGTMTVLEDASLAPGTVLADIGTAQRLLEMPGQISRVIVAPDQPMRQAALADVAADLMYRVAEGSPDLARLTGSFHLNLSAFGLLSFAVGLFIVHGAIGLVMEQRRGIVRTIRALGVSLHRLMALMLAEVVALALVAGAVGLVMGHLLAAALMPDVAATLRGLYGADVTGSLTLRPIWVLGGLAMACGGTLLAAGGALWRLSRMPVLVAGAPRAWAMAAWRGRRIQAVAAIALLSCAMGLATSQAPGLVAGFALLGTLLAGGALALPAFLAGLLRLAGAGARKPIAEWFWADTRQQLPGLSLALMALMLAMAANVGVSTMVSSFRLTFLGFIDQRLAPELYIGPEAGAELATLAPFVAARGGEVLPLQSADAIVMGQPAEVWGVRVGRTYRENWRFLDALPGAWDLVAAGEAIVVNEQLSRRLTLGPGDRLAVTSDLVLPVAGVVGDYGNPIGQVILAEPVFDRAFPGLAPQRFALRSDDAPALRQALVAELGLPDGAITDQAAVKALSVAVFDRTFAVTGALNVLTLGVAGFAMLTSLLTLASMRLPQLAPVWALGVTQWHLAWLDLLRSLLLAGITALLALPLGLALAWALLTVVNVAAFGWQLPVHLFPADYARLTALALLAAGLAAAWPAWRLARMRPSVLLGVFSHER